MVEALRAAPLLLSSRLFPLLPGASRSAGNGIVLSAAEGLSREQRDRAL